MQAKRKKLDKITAYMQTLQDKDGQSIAETRLYADVELTRKLIRTFIQEIVITNDNVKIKLNN